MHQNTNAVVIQDKNGKTTTVHRKNIVASSASASSLPAPSLQEKPSRESALRALSSFGVDLSDSVYGRKNIAYLAETHPKVLNELIEAISESDEADLWAYKLGKRDMYPVDDEDDSFYDYRKDYWRLIKTIPLASVLFPDREAGSRRRNFEQLVNLCDAKIGWPPSSKRYVETQAAMVTVVASGELMNFEFKGRMDDIFFMADHFEKVIPLIPSILERGDTSPGYVKALIENASAPLADGLL